MIEIKSLDKLGFDQIYHSFSQAFSDYDMPPLSKSELERMLIRRGFQSELSFGAFENSELVSFTFNGIGNFAGKKTAYDTGTGTVKEFRGKGLARKVFEESIPFLKEAGIEQYLLEVLQHNEIAISLYKSLGFEISREFNFYVKEMNELNLNQTSIPAAFHLKELNELKPELMETFWGFQASWQNSFDSILRRKDDFVFLGVFQEDELIAYGILDPETGDVAQIAVDKRFRRRGIGSGLLKELVKRNNFHSIKLINAEIKCYSMVQLMRSNRIDLSGKQFEMIRKI